MGWEICWYLVIGFSVMFYVVLDGFDLGVGMLHLFVKKDQERRVFLNAIGPVWDGNEVWLVIVGGALFAGFPDVYATLFSSFYNLSMIFLCGLIFRAAAIEFRSKMEPAFWRSLWDTVFSIASFIIAFGLGVVLGNLIEGIPLNEHKNFVGTFGHFFRPYTLLVGVMSTALFMMHGALYLVIKTEGALQQRLHCFADRCIIFFIASYIAVTGATLLYMPHMMHRMERIPGLFFIAFAALLLIANIPRELKKKREGIAFGCSCGAISLLFILFGIGTFPVLIRSSIDPEVLSLTLFNSASSLLTLKVLVAIVAIGIPLVLAYGFYVYRTFRGKVKIDHTSY